MRISNSCAWYFYNWNYSTSTWFISSCFTLQCKPRQTLHVLWSCCLKLTKSCSLLMCRFWVVNCISQQSCRLIQGNSHLVKFPLQVWEQVSYWDWLSWLILCLIQNGGWINAHYGIQWNELWLYEITILVFVYFSISCVCMCEFLNKFWVGCILKFSKIYSILIPILCFNKFL